MEKNLASANPLCHQSYQNRPKTCIINEQDIFLNDFKMLIITKLFNWHGAG